MSAHRKRPSPNRLNWLLIIIFAVLILGVFYALSSFGPRSVGSSREDRVTDEVALALLDESKELEQKFDDLLIQGIVGKDDMQVLNRAIELQKEYIAALPARDFVAESRLEQLEMRYDEYMGEILARDAQRLEAEARATEDPGQALIVFRDAVNIREQIRDQHGTSSHNDLTYLARLQREVQRMDVQPIYDRSIEKEKQAEEYASLGDLKGAVRMYGEAAELQEQINRAYPGLSLAKPLRASRLREKEAEVLSGELRRQIEDLISEANDLVYEKKYEEAAGVFSRARDMQRNLTLEYPRSPFASRTREDRLRVRMQNASAFSSYERLRDLEEMLNRSLIEGNFGEAKLLINQLSDRMGQFELRYSLSTLPVEELARRISYLSRNQRVLEQIRSTIQSDLVPIPGEVGLNLLATEVPQYLFEMIMDENPSRNVGGDLPVETVSLDEVELFLKRVSWVLAQEARLPTVEEFREAASEAIEAEDFAILSSGSGENATRPVHSLSADPLGFYHILGNVSEMVVLEEGSEGIAHMGGNLRTIKSQMVELNPVAIDTGERNRMVGFRFVVEDGIQPLTLPPDPEI